MDKYKADYEKKLEKLRRGKNAYAEIARHLIEGLVREVKLTSAGDLARICSVSNSEITKFVKEVGFENFSVMKFVHNNFQQDLTIEDSDKNFKDVANAIMKARKIFFMGVSNSFIINEDFANKLMRLDCWVIITPSKYEQVGLANLLTPSDLLIVNSISLQHEWMYETLKSTKAKKVLISSKKPLKLDLDFFFLVNSEERSDAFRIYTSKNRIIAHEIYDKIFYELYKRVENQLLLKATSYQ